MIAEAENGRMLTAARWLMLVYVVALPVVWPLDTRILGIHIFATDLLFAVAFTFWLWALYGRRPWLDLRHFAFAGVFFSALTISAIFSVEPRKSMLKVIGVLYLIAVSIVIADLVRDLPFLKKLTYAWIAGSVVSILGTTLGLVGFVAGLDTAATNFFLFHFGSLPPGNYPRVRAFFENPNMTANYLNVAVMIVLGAWRSGWMTGRTALGIASLLLGSAVFTISPGIGGIILSIGIWAWFVMPGERRGIRALVLAACVTTAILAFAATIISPVVRDAEHAVTLPLTGRQIEPSVRLLVWKDTIERGMEHPILGRGPGTDVAQLRYQVAAGHRLLLRDGHQAWLNVFGQAGLLGLAAFVGLCWYLVSRCRFQIFEASERNVILAACSCAFLGAFLFQNLSGSFEDARQLWVLSGMLVGLSGIETEAA